MHMFSVTPKGPFDLTAARDYFDKWPVVGDELAVTFPVEGWKTSAVVTLKPNLEGTVHGAGAHAEQAWRQVLTALSLDHDGSGYPEVGKRDPVVGRIMRELGPMRPICFLSPYECAVALVLGQRSSIAQQRRTRARLAEELGDKIRVSDRTYHAFPRPQIILEQQKLAGVSAQKLAALHAVAEAALAGKLSTAYLRDRPYAAAIEQLRTLRGIGEWTSQGIVLRGAGLVDEVPDDMMTKKELQAAYSLPEPPTHAEVVARAEAWRPYRMWTIVLLHVWFRRS